MYHHKKDSGISLGETWDKESVQSSPQSPRFSDHYSPQPDKIFNVASNFDIRQPRTLKRGLHFSQLTESERVKLFDNWFEIPPIRPDERKPKILSSYPIPYNYTILDPLHPESKPQPAEKENLIWNATYGINGKRKGLERFFEDYEFLHNGGESPSDEMNLFNKFPSEFAAEKERQMRRQAAELHQRLRKMRRHQGSSSESNPCDRVLPSTLLFELPSREKEEPERWFKTLDEAWEHRPSAKARSKHQKVSS